MRLLDRIGPVTVNFNHDLRVIPRQKPLQQMQILRLKKYPLILKKPQLRLKKPIVILRKLKNSTKEGKVILLKTKKNSVIANNLKLNELWPSQRSLKNSKKRKKKI